jgi:hypothetical protein
MLPFPPMSYAKLDPEAREVNTETLGLQCRKLEQIVALVRAANLSLDSEEDGG